MFLRVHEGRIRKGMFSIPGYYLKITDYFHSSFVFFFKKACILFVTVNTNVLSYK
jgi:hypothetical protein